MITLASARLPVCFTSRLHASTHDSSASRRSFSTLLSGRFGIAGSSPLLSMKYRIAWIESSGDEVVFDFGSDSIGRS
jgi:hypothetical protein